MIPVNNRAPYAEVIASTTREWKGHAWDYALFPSFGSLVSVSSDEHGETIAVVYHIERGSSDPHRSPYPYQKTHDQLRMEQPHIFSFLSTTFSCISLGFITHHKPFYMIPPSPPAIHAFITSPSPESQSIFFHKPHYLHLLLSSSIDTGTRDELVLSLIASMRHLPDHRAYITDLIHTYRMLSGADYRSLRLFLDRIASLF